MFYLLLKKELYIELRSKELILSMALCIAKKEEFNIWLDDKSKIILKVSYSKFGDWEYIVTNVEKFY